MCCYMLPLGSLNVEVLLVDVGYMHISFVWSSQNRVSSSLKQILKLLPSTLCGLYGEMI